MEEPKRKFEKVDTYIIYACVFFLCASLSILSKNYLFSDGENLGNVRIGKISLMTNSVRRKFESGMMWYDTKTSEVLFENDWIYTGASSTVTIAFDDGGELTLEPNSLVILTRKKGMMKLELQHGSFIADLKKGTEISVVKNGKTETIRAQDKKLKVSDDTEQIAEVIEEPKELEDEFAGLNITVGDSFINAQKPNNRTTILVSDRTADISFEWEASDGFQKFLLEISNTEDFNKPISQEFENDFANMIIPFKGKIYWRVSAQAKDGKVTSEISTFKIKQNTAPLAKSPEDNKNLLTKISKDDEAFVEFEWEDQGNLWTNYELEVSTTPGFTDDSTIAHDSLVGKLNRIPIAEQGSYFWRIRGKNENGEQKSNWSPPRKFNFKIDFHKELVAIKLTKKNITHYLKNNDYKVIDSDKIVDLEQKNDKAIVSWKPHGEASFYKAELSNTEDFSDIIQELEVTDTKAPFTKSRLGKSYFRITPQFDNGDTAAPAYGTLKIYLPSPRVLTSKQKGKFFNLAWSASPAIDEYEVTYYDHPLEQERQTLYFKSNEVKIKNSNGFLSWKVRAIDPKTREPLTHYTKLNKIAGKVLASIPDKNEGEGFKFPKIISPPKKKTFLTFENNPTFVLMRWKYSEKYTKFELEISTNPDMSFVMLTRKVSKKKTVIRKTFKPGKYYFRVRAINKDIKGPWSPPQVFRFIQNSVE